MLWINGKPGDSISPLDRGFAYGDGVFETMRVIDGAVPLWKYHRDRLLHGLDVLGFSIDAKVLDSEIARAGHAQGNGVLKLTITRGKGGKAYQPPVGDDVHPLRILQGRALLDDGLRARDGCTVIACRTRLGTHPQLAGLKHLNRLEQVLAAREVAVAGADEGVMCDAKGNVVEGTFTNLFAVKNGKLLTPPITGEQDDEAGGGVAGVMRRWLLERTSELKLEFEEMSMTLDDLHAMDEVFVCNSVIGIWPVRRLEDRELASGTMTRTLQNEIATLFPES